MEVQKRIFEWIKKGDVEAVLDLSGLKLDKCPMVPPTVKKLNISNNSITEVMLLPPSLRELNCSNNKISKLMLSPKLEVLVCDNNELKVYPTAGESVINYMKRLVRA